jgi:hypothetical protein
MYVQVYVCSNITHIISSRRFNGTVKVTLTVKQIRSSMIA